MKQNILLTPGPTMIPQEVLDALALPIIHHRTPQFQNYLKEAVEGLQYIFQTKSDIHIIVGSGTAGMEAAVCNFVSPGDKVITVEGGKFGERWTELAQTYKADAHVIQVKWGQAVTAGQIKEALAKHAGTKAVYITLTETSTGVTTDIKSIADIVKKTDAILVVDGVSGVGVTNLEMDTWGVDVVVSASHKGFMLPPGLAFVATNDKAYALMAKSTTPKYYLDLKQSQKAWTSVDTPFTTAISIVIGLTVSLKIMKAQGLKNLFAHYAHLANGTREAAKALGLSVYADASCVSNVLTPINLPEGINGEKLVKTMRDTYGVTVAGGQGELKGKIIRIAHMGCVSEDDIIAGIACFETVLKEMGHKFKEGSGVAAAKEAFGKMLNGV